MQLHLNVYKQPVCKVCGSQIETKSSRQEIVIIVQYVKNKEKSEIMPKVIGLTGGIASGKSTVSELLSVFGFKVVDADKAAREAVKRGVKV